MPYLRFCDHQNFFRPTNLTGPQISPPAPRWRAYAEARRVFNQDRATVLAPGPARHRLPSWSTVTAFFCGGRVELFFYGKAGGEGDHLLSGDGDLPAGGENDYPGGLAFDTEDAEAAEFDFGI